MKNFLVTVIISFIAISAAAQDAGTTTIPFENKLDFEHPHFLASGYFESVMDHLVYNFSAEGRQNWKPEFTVRSYTGLYTNGPAVTAGVRVDDQRTFGIWLGRGHTYIDAAPGSIMAIQPAAYMRRYFHLGRRDMASLYGELILGCNWIYEVSGKYQIYDDPDSGEHREKEVIKASKGDVDLYAGINAGLKIRLIKNVHLFFGPTLTTNTIGFHFGVGF